LQVATVATLQVQSLIYPRNGKVQNSKSYVKHTMNVLNAITSAMCSILFMEAHTVTYR